MLMSDHRDSPDLDHVMRAISSIRGYDYCDTCGLWINVTLISCHDVKCICQMFANASNHQSSAHNMLNNHVISHGKNPNLKLSNRNLVGLNVSNLLRWNSKRKKTQH